MESIETIRAKYEPQILATKGVVSVSIGVSKKKKACLKIGTSVPIEQVRPKLPKEIFQIEVELEYVGKIRSQ